MAGGDCISDINRLEQDKGLKELLQSFATQGMKRSEKRAYLKRWRKENKRGLPSKAAIHRFLGRFHSEEEESKRVEGKVLRTGLFEEDQLDLFEVKRRSNMTRLS